MPRTVALARGLGMCGIGERARGDGDRATPTRRVPPSGRLRVPLFDGTGGDPVGESPPHDAEHTPAPARHDAAPDVAARAARTAASAYCASLTTACAAASASAHTSTIG